MDSGVTSQEAHGIVAAYIGAKAVSLHRCCQHMSNAGIVPLYLNAIALGAQVTIESVWNESAAQNSF